MKKRGKGVYKKDLGILDIYQVYRDLCKKDDKKPFSAKLHRNILNDFNLLFKERLLDGKTMRLPCRLGNIRINKFEKNFSEDRRHRFILFKESNDNNTIVYDTRPYGYKFFWDRKKCIVQNRGYYLFKPCRQIKRDLAYRINVLKQDYL